MYSTAALMLANGHIGDLMADASRERRANLLRAAHERATRPRNHGTKRATLTAVVLAVALVAQMVGFTPAA